MFGNRFGFAAHSYMVAALACGMTIGISAGTTPGWAAEITVTDAKIAAGKLVVTGKTLTTNTPPSFRNAAVQAPTFSPA
jgi:hypothetical protein